MSTPWTPGKWQLDDEFRVLADDEQRTIIHVPPCSWTNLEAQADSRLIAAAPELADALQGLLQTLSIRDEGEADEVAMMLGMNLGVIWPMITAARAALAKAKEEGTAA